MTRTDPCAECGAYEEDGSHIRPNPCEHEHVETGAAPFGAETALTHRCADCGAALANDGYLDDDGQYRPSWAVL